MEYLEGISWAASTFFSFVFQTDIVSYILMLALVVLAFDIIVEVFNHEKD